MSATFSAKPKSDRLPKSNGLLESNRSHNANNVAVAKGIKYVLISIMKFIQSTYEVPPYKNLGMEQILNWEQQKRDPEAVCPQAQFLEHKHIKTYLSRPKNVLFFDFLCRGPKIWYLHIKIET